jgi:hypothetical protein
MCTVTVLQSTCYGNIASADRKALDHTGLLGIHTAGGAVTVEL